MFERFTDRARRVVVLAQEEARMLGHDYIGTEHILLGLIHEGEGVAAKALRSLQINLAAVRQKVEEIIGQGKGPPSGHIPFTPRAKKVLEYSLREALQLGHNYIGTEHILLGLIREGEGVAAQALKSLGADLGTVRQQVVRQVQSAPAEAGGGSSVEVISSSPRGPQLFCRDLTGAARADRLDPVIGREDEIGRLAQVLAEEPRANPVLVGGPGVGKSSTVEGLAAKIATGDVPEPLRGIELHALDLGALIAGERGRRVFRRRLERTLAGLRDRGGVILFIEDVDALVAADAIAAASVLRPMLTEGTLRIIGATTPAGYDEHLAREAMRDCRLQPIEVSEPSAVEAIEIIKGVRHLYESPYGVSITDGAIAAAVRLTGRNIGDRLLPGKAIDLLEAAGAKARAGGPAGEPDVAELDRELAELRGQKEVAIDRQDFETAAELRNREKELLRQKSQRTAQTVELTAQVVAEVFTAITGIAAKPM
jgi:ATP-dependent Clp protease ATP-binding subunit ClpC